MIEELTLEQKKLMAIVREEWIDKIQLPLDLEKATKGINYLYQKQGLNSPRIIVKESLVQFMEELVIKESVRESVREPVWESV